MNKPPSKSPRQSIIDRGTAPNASEDAIQTCCFLLLHDYRIECDDGRLDFIHAIPNGGDRDKVSAGVMVATGTRSGVWDIHFPFPSGRFPFGYVEMKRPKVRNHKNGGLTDNQVTFGKHLANVGAWYAICYSAVEFMNAVSLYRQGKSYYETAS